MSAERARQRSAHARFARMSESPTKRRAHARLGRQGSAKADAPITTALSDVSERLPTLASYVPNTETDELMHTRILARRRATLAPFSWTKAL